VSTNTAPWTLDAAVIVNVQPNNPLHQRCITAVTYDCGGLSVVNDDGSLTAFIPATPTRVAISCNKWLRQNRPNKPLISRR